MNTNYFKSICFISMMFTILSSPVSAQNKAAKEEWKILFNGKDLKKALEWMTIGIETGNKEAFWNIHTKAKIQDALGDKKGAIATAQQSLELAKKSKDGDFGYTKLNEDLIAKITAELPVAKPAKKK